LKKGDKIAYINTTKKILIRKRPPRFPGSDNGAALISRHGKGAQKPVDTSSVSVPKMRRKCRPVPKRTCAASSRDSVKVACFYELVFNKGVYRHTLS